MKIGEFNLGIQDGDKVEMHFIDKIDDKDVFAFIFQGYMPNGYVWLKAMRLYIAKEKFSNGRDLAHLSPAMQNRYGFEIHIHAYFINNILPQMFKHQLPPEYEQKNEVLQTIKNIGEHLEKDKIHADNTRGMPHVGDVYAARYQNTKNDYETLTRDWQEIEQRYQRELQELHRLASNANAAIFTVSISSDLKVVPDGSAVQLALKDCLQELNMRHNAVIGDPAMQHIHFAVVQQPYFFFLSELAGLFNPAMLASMARDPYIFELYKAMFPAINAKSMLQTNLENMRYLSSNAPAEMLRKILQQMEVSVPTVMPQTPQQQTIQGTIQGEQKRFIRADYLDSGILIGKDESGGDVRINFKTLDKHILIEGQTKSGKSHFAKMLATKAIEDGLNVIVMDTTWGWTYLVARHSGRIFDNRLDAADALNHKFSLCVVEKGSIVPIEENYLKPLVDYLLKERIKKRRKVNDILLIIDEAQNFGMRSKGGVLAELAAEMGKYGIIIALVTQRKQYLNIDARSQAALRFFGQTNEDYFRSQADAYQKDFVEQMLRIKKYNFLVHGTDINIPFELYPEKHDEGDELPDEVYELYRYKGFDAPKVEIKPEPAKEPIIPIPEKPQEPIQTPVTPPVKEEQKPKEEPLKPKIEEPKKEGWDLNDFQRTALKALFDNPDGFESYNQWFISIGRGGFFGEETKVRNILRDKGYIEIVPDPERNKKKIGRVRITEKGKTVF